MAHFHSFFGLGAVMLLFQVKNCVKLAAQEMKILLNSYQTSYSNETCRNICLKTKIQAAIPVDTIQALNQKP